MKLFIDGKAFDVRPAQPTWLVDGEPAPVKLTTRRRRGESWELEGQVGDRHGRWWVTPLPDGTLTVTGPGGLRVIATADTSGGGASGPYGPMKSPMAGVLTSLTAVPGAHVAAGDELVVIEAMKMRYAVTAPAAGIITDVSAIEGARVSAGQPLLTLAAPPA